MMAIDPVFSWVARLLVSALFVSTALHKLRSPRAFAEIVRDYSVVPDRLVALVVATVVLLEAAIGCGVWIPALKGVAGFTGAALLAVYAAAIGLNLARGRREIDCGCTWGATGQPLSAWLLARNAALAWVCLLAGATDTGRAYGATDLGVAVLGACVLALCYRAFETLLANLPRLRRLEG